MRRENLERMSRAEVEEYARASGIPTAAAKGKEAMIELVEARRERTATVRALGCNFEIPQKRLGDLRVSALLSKGDRTDGESVELLRLLLGDEQFERALEAVTDEDGTVDVAALGLLMVKIVYSAELKNS